MEKVEVKGEQEGAWFALVRKDVVITPEVVTRVLRAELLAAQLELAEINRQRQAISQFSTREGVYPGNTASPAQYNQAIESRSAELTLLKSALPLDSFFSLVCAKLYFKRNLLKLQEEEERRSKFSYTLSFPALEERDRMGHKRFDKDFRSHLRLIGSQKAMEFIDQEFKKIT